MTDASSQAHRKDPQRPAEQPSGLDSARQSASHLIEQTRDKAGEALDASRETVAANPLGVLIGGLAAGAVAGALLPRSAKEREVLAPVGKRLAAAAVVAVAAAKEAGRAELDARGLTVDAARDRSKDLFQGVAQALSSAGSAAAKSATEKPADTSAA